MATISASATCACHTHSGVVSIQHCLRCLRDDRFRQCLRCLCCQQCLRCLRCLYGLIGFVNQVDLNSIGWVAPWLLQMLRIAASPYAHPGFEMGAQSSGTMRYGRPRCWKYPANCEGSKSLSRKKIAQSGRQRAMVSRALWLAGSLGNWKVITANRPVFDMAIFG